MLTADKSRAIVHSTDISPDGDALDVGRDQQRRILQGARVLQELPVRGVQTLVLALVLPGEPSTPPHVSPALATTGLGGALLIRRNLNSTNGKLLIGGVEVTKFVSGPKFSNSRKSHSFDVSFSWTDPVTGEQKSHDRDGRFSSNRSNDPDRTWGLGRE